MARRKVLKLTPVLVTLNVLVLLIIASFYITRLVKYYLLENGTKKPNEATILVDTLIKKQSYLDLTKGLVLDEETNTYIYKGDVKDNYVTVSGSKTISIDNKVSRISIRGDVALSNLKGNNVKAADLMDERLEITTAVDNAYLPLTDEDLDESSDVVVLTEEKKRDLLVKYLNKMLNVLF